MHFSKLINEETTRRVCSKCGRQIPRSTEGDLCETCKSDELYAKVKEYINQNSPTELEVAEEFNIPLAQVRKWIHEGHIEYKTNPFA